MEPSPERVGDDEQRRRPRVRRRRRKWKPYSRLTWTERKELEERDARRANRLRAEMLAFGHTLAPYNTTQFLMDDHNLQEPDYEHISGGARRAPEENPAEDYYYSSPEDEEDFFQRQFAEAYEDIHVQRLDGMSKAELVQELMCMEDKVESLEKSLKYRRIREGDVAQGPDVEAQVEKIRVFREEIQKLAKENEGLRREKERLMRQCELRGK